MAKIRINLPEELFEDAEGFDKLRGLAPVEETEETLDEEEGVEEDELVDEEEGLEDVV